MVKGRWLPMVALLAPIVLFNDTAWSAPLGPEHLLILVNDDSPVSRSIANLYRELYPAITDEQVLALPGLPDSASLTATPADEIITRDQFETLIAQPVRDHLISRDMVDSIYCLVTTAGMPYRIEDTDPSLANVVKPAASNAPLTLENRGVVNAASVESELAVLFQIDPALTPGEDGPGVAIENRIVNPYHGYASGIRSWEAERDILGRRSSFTWEFNNLWPVNHQPRIEGGYDWGGCSSTSRIMSPADIYLVARLDGPHQTGRYAIFAVMEMLKRSLAVSRPGYGHFVGYSGADTALVIDHAPTASSQLAYTPSFNYPAGVVSLLYEDDPVPPGAEVYQAMFCQRGGGNHYEILFEQLTGVGVTAGAKLAESIAVGLGGTCVWDDTGSVVDSEHAAFPAGAGLIGLQTYGRNGGEGRSPTYLLTDGPGGGPLFTCSPGAVFSSIESFNAVTMFTDVATGQGKIAEFIEMGGTAAVGHAFEPEVSAIIQAEHLFGNLLRDQDGDGVGDLTLVEAVFSALPYLSWSEVFIGDPLMRLHEGPGGLVESDGHCIADIDGDGWIGFWDYIRLTSWYWEKSIGDEMYSPTADFDQDGYVGWTDLMAFFSAGGFNGPCD